MDVLVYSGPGSSELSVAHCISTLREILSPHYSVTDVDESVLLKEPWEASTALLVMPGGADLPMCAALNGKGNDRIRSYVQRGGRYLGTCAGAYYGCKQIEFEVGDPNLEVTGPRELGFFPGLAKGSVTPGFDYESERGAKALYISYGDNKQAAVYVNGGPYFVDAHNVPSVEVLATYKGFAQSDDTDIQKALLQGSQMAAVVLCSVGKGKALLTGPHLEHLVPESHGEMDAMTKSLLESNPERLDAMRLFLKKLGLKVGDHNVMAMPLSPMFLSSIFPSATEDLLEKWRKGFVMDDSGNLLLECPNDTFIVHTDNTVPDNTPTNATNVPKHIISMTTGWPDQSMVPEFNHHVFYTVLEEGRRKINLTHGKLGNHILYGKVVTSTSSMLQYNPSFLKTLPHGFVAVGSVQIAGRGRGKNVWVNPMGVLGSTGVLRHPINTSQTPSILVFTQYICGLAMVEAIRNYAPGFQDFPIHIKWPNDLYVKLAHFEKSGATEKMHKVGGVLTSSTVDGDEYVLLYGTGVNVANSVPPYSLNYVIDIMNQARESSAHLPHMLPSALLARFLVTLEQLLEIHKVNGFAGLESLYYSRWLHQNQVIHLEQHDNMRATIRGIDPQHGTLVVEETTLDGRLVGRQIQLQPDGNSFDMLKGLIMRKT